MQISYLNTDLEIESERDLSLILVSRVDGDFGAGKGRVVRALRDLSGDLLRSRYKVAVTPSSNPMATLKMPSWAARNFSHQFLSASRIFSCRSGVVAYSRTRS